MLDVVDRVRANTPAHINERIDAQIAERVAQYAWRCPLEITARIEALEREWDVERWLEANAATISLVSLLLAARDRRWLPQPLAVAGFLLQHALQGWCPPLAVFRRLGVRTRREIERERQAMKALRDDFTVVVRDRTPANAMTAAQR